MGATATLVGSPFVALLGLSSLSLSLVYIFSEGINKYRIQSNYNNPVKSSLVPQIYKIAFTQELEKYINNSKTDDEKKYKIILTSFALKKIGLEPQTVITDCFDKSYNWSEKYSIYTSEGKMVELFGGNKFHINYKNLTSEDFKDPEKINIAKEVYQDFAHLGMLGKEVSRIFGFYPNTEFLLDMQGYILNDSDILHIQKSTENIMAKSSENRAMNQPAKGKEEDFIFEIIKNNPQHIKVLHKFHTEIHCHNNMCSYPKLIDFVNERLNIFQIKEKLDNNLTEKAETKAKPKKI